MRILLLTCLCLLPALAAAQSCCDIKRNAGQTAYNSGNYETAIAKWQEGKKCSDAASCTDLDNLISKARQKIKQRDDAAAKQRQQQAAAEKKRLADKADDDAWELVKDSQDPKTVQKYLDKYPPGRHASDARKRLKELSPAETKPATTSPSSGGLGGAEPEMLKIAGGSFRMGSEENSDEKPVHEVTVSSFWLGKYEVTNAQFCAFLNEKGNQSEGDADWLNLDGSYDDERCRIYAEGTGFKVRSGYENYPVIFVSWYGAKAYCDWLAAKTGKKYRLPTEAEWEYAAGNGQKHTKYSWGNSLPSGKQGGNVADQSAKKKYPSWDAFENYDDGYIYTAPAGQFNANDFGLHDMTGNVWEWCSDWYGADYYASSPSTNPKGPSSGDYRGCRGGSWSTGPISDRVAYRSRNYPGDRSNYIGFRAARD